MSYSNYNVSRCVAYLPTFTSKNQQEKGNIYIYIYQRWMVWVRVKSCQVYLFNDLYHCFGKPTQHVHTFPILLSTNPLKKHGSTMFHYIFHCAPIKSPLYRHVCFIPHVLQFRTFFMDQNHFFCLKPHILIVTR